MDAFEAIHARHGVLRFKPTPVEPEKIERVLEAAVAAPSPANTQPWAFVVVTEPALARRVAEYLVRTQEAYVFRRLLETPEPFIAHLLHLYDDFYAAPCFIVLCRHRRVDLAPPEYDAVVRDWELCALGAAMSNLMTAATALGLGTRWFGNPMMDESGDLRRLLRVPDHVEIVAVTPLGYHDEPSKERPVQPLAAHTGFQRGDKYKLAALLKGKLALADVVHQNRWVQLGQTFSVSRVFSQQDFDRFAALSGDDNPIHVDPAFSAQTKFGRTVAHGMLLYSAVCAALSEWLPGAVQMEQELMFPSPTYVGQPVTIRLQVTRHEPERGRVELSTVLTKADGSVGLEGRTLVRLPGTPSTNHPTSQPTNQRATQPASCSPATFKHLAIGQRAETRRMFTLPDLAEYADLTGDTNAVFSDAGYARQAGLNGPIIPGGLIGGLFSYLLGTRLPGRGTNYLKQRLVFPAPAYPDQELRASVEIVRLRPEKQLVNLRTFCYNPGGEVVCYGEALVLVSDVEGSSG